MIKQSSAPLIDLDLVSQCDQIATAYCSFVILHENMLNL